MTARRPRLALAFVALLLAASRATAQDVALTPDAEVGFRRFIAMAQQGRLGADVRNVNVGIARDRVRLELLRDHAAPIVVLLAPRRAADSASAFFAVSAGEGAGPDDVARVARLLDEAFDDDPFQLRVSEAAPDAPVPSLGEVLTAGNWRRVLHMFERRMTSLASAQYTKAVTIALAVGFALSLGVLWLAQPPPRPRRNGSVRR